MLRERLLVRIGKLSPLAETREGLRGARAVVKLMHDRKSRVLASSFDLIERRSRALIKVVKELRATTPRDDPIACFRSGRVMKFVVHVTHVLNRTPRQSLTS